MATATTARTSHHELTSAEVRTLRAMLEQQRRFRREQLVALTRADVVSPFGSGDHEVSATLATGARAALRDVEAALRRIDEGRYGRCITCHESVGRERLEILPQVAHCLRCHRTALGVDGSRTGSGASRRGE